MCRNQYDPYVERQLAALQEARGGDGLGKSQEEGRTEQAVQSRPDRRSGRFQVVLADLRADPTTIGQSAQAPEEGTGVRNYHEYSFDLPIGREFYLI